MSHSTSTAPLSNGQRGMIGALMTELGITERQAALAYVADVIGHAVTSRNDLSKAEASRVIEALEADRSPRTPVAPMPEPSRPIEDAPLPDPSDEQDPWS